MITFLAITACVAAFIIYRQHATPASSDAGGSHAGAGGGHGRGGGPTPVTVATARSGTMDRYLVGLGNVTPFATATVRSRVDGAIMKVEFIEGQTVKTGDPLFEIDTRPYDVQLATAEGQMARDTALWNNAKVQVQRDKEAGNAIAAQQLDTDTATAAQDEGNVKIDQAAIDSAKLNITYCHIASPIDGRIGLRLVDLGNYITASSGTSLAVITQLHPIAVVFSLPEDDIPRTIKAMAADPKLKVEAYARDLRTLLATGFLLTIDNEVDPTAGTFRLKGQFANTDNSLFPSQFVSSRMLVETLKGTVIVPSAAVQQGQDFTYVYIVKEDKTVELRKVTVTQTSGNEMLLENPRPANAGDESSIEKGLSPGEVVVTDGIDKLQNGSTVQVGGEGRGGRGGHSDATASQASDSSNSTNTTGGEMNASGAPIPQSLASDQKAMQNATGNAAEIGGQNHPAGEPSTDQPASGEPGSSPDSQHRGHHGGNWKGGAAPAPASQPAS